MYTVTWSYVTLCGNTIYVKYYCYKKVYYRKNSNIKTNPKQSINCLQKSIMLYICNILHIFLPFHMLKKD